MSDQDFNGTRPSGGRVLLYLVIAAVLITPFAMILWARTHTQEQPRIQILQDMGHQPRFRPEAYTDVFPDHRAMRIPPAQAVPHTDEGLGEDDHYYRGYATDSHNQPVMVKAADGTEDKKWFSGLPPQVPLNMDLLKRGQERFKIYCSVCHGYGAYGDGQVQRHASQPGVSEGWVQPMNLQKHDADGKLVFGEDQYPSGKIFNTITHGMRTMPAYGKQIPVADRWAIIAYVRALQFAQNYPTAKLAAGTRIDSDEEWMLKLPVKLVIDAKASLDDPGLIEAGKVLFNEKYPCSTCHLAPGGPCPPFGDKSVYPNGPVGEKEHVTDGIGGAVKEITIDEAYVHESVKSPMAKIVVSRTTHEPYPPIMVLSQTPSDAEIHAIYAYLRSFGKK